MNLLLISGHGAGDPGATAALHLRGTTFTSTWIRCRSRCHSSTMPSLGFLRRRSRISFSSASVCWLGWLWGRLDWQAKEASVPSHRAFQKQMYDRLLLYFRLARLTPYFSAYFIGDCRYAMSCVILLLMKDMAPSRQVVCSQLQL